MMQRNLYLTTIPVDQAKKMYLEALDSDISPRPETINVTDALGRITAEASGCSSISRAISEGAMGPVMPYSSTMEG